MQERVREGGREGVRGRGERRREGGREGEREREGEKGGVRMQHSVVPPSTLPTYLKMEGMYFLNSKNTSTGSLPLDFTYKEKSMGKLQPQHHYTFHCASNFYTHE